jgi:hypothetical protein
MTCMSIAFAQLPSEINHKHSRTNALSLTDEVMALLADRYRGEKTQFVRFRCSSHLRPGIAVLETAQVPFAPYSG